MTGEEGEFRVPMPPCRPEAALRDLCAEEALYQEFTDDLAQAMGDTAWFMGPDGHRLGRLAGAKSR